MQFTADQIWALAVAADRINSGYVKDTVMNYDVEPPVVTKEANKLMVKRWLREGTFPATEFAVISCLPSAARRDAAHVELKREIYTSEQLVGNPGDVIVGDIAVISSRFNQNYLKYKITARMGESFIDFWHSQELVGELRIKGKIKNVRGDKTTQLNYVKITG